MIVSLSTASYPFSTNLKESSTVGTNTVYCAFQLTIAFFTAINQNYDDNQWTLKKWIEIYQTQPMDVIDLLK